MFLKKKCKKDRSWPPQCTLFLFEGFPNANKDIQVGIPLEIISSWWRVCLVYILGVLLSSLTMPFQFPHFKVAAGASGGIYALVFANISNIFLNFLEDCINHRREISQSAAVTHSSFSWGRNVKLLFVRLVSMLGVLSFDIISSLILLRHTNYQVHLPG